METIANVEPVAVCARVMQIFFGSFIYIYLIAKLVGPDNKLAWFRKRKKYTFFNSRVSTGWGLSLILKKRVLMLPSNMKTLYHRRLNKPDWTS